MKPSDSAHIFVFGNEKGGAGKTTCSMHLISSLLTQGFKVASIDTDSRQHSLTSYINNREAYNQKNSDKPVPMPWHFHLAESEKIVVEEQENDYKARFEEIIEKVKNLVEYIVIDTPGNNSYLSKLAHSYADTIITPLNDSFVDLNVMAKVRAEDLTILSPSIYSQMVWEQKMQKAKREQKSINWIVVRNRLSNLDAVNKRKVGQVLSQLAKRVSFKIAPGFSERVIFRELFLQGLTLLDLKTANYDRSFSISHVAARQELRDFLSYLEIPVKDL